MEEDTLEILNPQELRIGNYVGEGLTRSLCRVTQIEKDNVVVATAISECSKINFKMLLGIPLSATRLIEMGFIQDKENECLFRHSWFELEVVYIHESRIWHFIGIYSDPASQKKKIERGVLIYSSVFISVNTKLQYVHEYQNLYFEMTQTELFIQDNVKQSLTSLSSSLS